MGFKEYSVIKGYWALWVQRSAERWQTPILQSKSPPAVLQPHFVAIELVDKQTLAEIRTGLGFRV